MDAGERIWLSTLRGQPVVSAGGERLGRVRAAVVDLAARRLRGVRLRHGGLLDRRWRLAAWSDVVRLDGDAIVLSDALALLEDESHTGHLLMGRRRPPLVDRDGRTLGYLADLGVDRRSGAVLELLVAGTGRWPRQGGELVAVPVERAAGWRFGGIPMTAPSAAEPPCVAAAVGGR
jgi:sporulation protein YlmC with PRC-barrel domain